ncbi:MAG: hypothetical protein ACM31L_02085 [Actinomycetota bacterium]
MPFPAFFDQVPTIRVIDPLAAFLGAGDGVIDYGYADAVKLAGHSCPTVAAAYMMTARALAALYGDATPVRGEIRVSLADGAAEGTTGVVAAVAGLITGARGEDGFKGIGGHFVRAGLLDFDQPLGTTIAYARADGGGTVYAEFNGGRVPSSPEMSPLLRAVLGGTAAEGDAARFAELWQDRVRRILVDHWDDPELVMLRRAG